MGCDIHFYVETKNDNGVWENFVDGAECSRCKGKGTVESENPDEDDEDEDDEEPRDCYECHGTGKEPMYDGRNYWLFGVLAGVRGSHVPIAPPRGLPDDASAFVKKASDDYGTDGHSHSHLSLTDLEEFPWNGVYQCTEWAGVQAWLEYRATGNLRSGKGVVSTRRHKECSPDMMNKYIHGLVDIPPETSLVTKVHWDKPVLDMCPYFVEQTMSRLRQAATTKGGPDNVRIVIFFDN